MPLSCDCYGGCWGDHSKNWPSVEIPQKLIEEAKAANPHYPAAVAATRLETRAGIPYGSAVLVDRSLRVETQMDLRKVLDVLEKLNREQKCGQ